MMDHSKKQGTTSLLDRSTTSSQVQRLHASSLSFDIQSRFASSPANTPSPKETHTAPSSISSGRRTSRFFKASTLAALAAIGHNQSERQHSSASEKPIQEYQDQSLLMAPFSSREELSAGYSSDVPTPTQTAFSKRGLSNTSNSAAALAMRKPRLSVNNLRRLAQPGLKKPTSNSGSNHLSEARSNLPSAKYNSRKSYPLRHKNKWWLQQQSGPVDEKSSTHPISQPTSLENSHKHSFQHPVGSQRSEGRLVWPTDHSGLQTSNNAIGAEDSSSQPENGFINLRGEKHLSSRGDLPYWMSYRPEVIDHHILMLYASALMQGSAPFELCTSTLSSGASLLNQPIGSTSPVCPPGPSGRRRRVLDVGCGPSATWCVGVLRAENDVEVVGLDVCPLLLDLSAIESEVSERFSFVKHNFTGGKLPFEDANFDYVHGSFIASGVAEFQWTPLLEDMMRVLKPGCPIELLECNHFVADPLHSEPVLQELGQRRNHGHSTLGATAHCNRTGRPSTAEPERTKAQDREALPTTVKQMIEIFLEQNFISSFPLSVIPNELSMISAGSLHRPLKNKFIWLPNNLENGIRERTEYTSGSTTNVGRITDTPSLEAQTDSDQSINSLLLQSHVHALAASKEHIWEEVWLPRIRLNLGDSSGHILPTNLGPAEAVRGSVDQTQASLASDSQRQALKPFLRSLASVGDGTSDTMPVKTGFNYQPATDCERPSSSFARVSRVELQARRKFDQIWSNWKQSLDWHSAGVSRLLEDRFGWTCQMNTEEHDVLDRRHKEYLEELNDCEAELGQLRKNVVRIQLEISTLTLGQRQDEGRRKLREFKARVAALQTKESELHDLIESIEPDLITAKRRLGLMDELHVNTSFGNDTQDSLLEKSDFFFHNQSRSSGVGLKEVSSQRSRISQPPQGSSQALGKLAIEKFISRKKTT